MPLPSPFSMEQQRWIIFRYGACQSVKAIRREFRQKFDVYPHNVPGEYSFYRIIKRFNTSNSTVAKSKKEDGAGRPMTGRSPEKIETIRQSITKAGDQSIRALAVLNDIPQTTVQRILRKDLRKETVKKAVKDIISRAGCCLNNGGSAFESKLKAYKRIL